MGSKVQATEIAFTGQSYPTPCFDQNHERTINYYPYYDDSQGQDNAKIILRSCPGATSFTTTTGSRGRAGITVNDTSYCVIDNSFYILGSNNVLTQKGTLRTSTSKVFMAVSDIAVGTGYVLIVDGTYGYLYNITTDSFAIPSDLDFPDSPIHCSYKDGYFIVISGNHFWLSAPGDGAAWDGLDFASATQIADNLYAAVPFGGDLWLFGDVSVETYVNSVQPNATDPTVTFPYTRREGSVLHYGCRHTSTIAVSGDRLLFLAKPVSGGYLPVSAQAGRVSPLFNPAVVEVINGFSFIDDCFGFVFNDSGTEFYCLTFPTAKRTFIAEVNRQLTHERDSWDGLDYTHWFASFFLFHNNKRLVGDYLSGNVYELTTTSCVERDYPIRRVRRTRPFCLANTNISAYFLTLMLETGVAAATGQGSNPTMILRIYRDGGHIPDTEMVREVGMTGDFVDRAIFESLGCARKWCFESITTDPIPWTIVQCFAEFSQGLN